MTRTPFSRLFLSLLFAAILLVCPQQGLAFQAIIPPAAPVHEKAMTVHGDTRKDPYFYMRERENPEVSAYIKAENAYTEAMMKSEEGLQKKLFAEMKSRIQEKDISVPQKLGEYFYYDRDEQGKEYKIHCRRKGSMNAREEIILDENELAKGKPFFAVGSFRVSPDHRFLAYSTDISGNEKYTLFIKDLAANRNLPEEIAGTYYGLEWGNDNRTVFYVMPDPVTNRASKVFRHILGTPASSDKLAYEEKDEKFSVSLLKTKDKKWILIQCGSYLTDDVQMLSADEPLGKFTAFLQRKKGVKYSIEHHDKSFFILSNENAPDFKIMETPDNATGPDNWKEFAGHRRGCRIEDMEMFADFIVFYELQNAYKTIRYYHFPTGRFQQVPFDEWVYGFSRGQNPEYKTSVLRYVYFSPRTPETVYDFDMATGKREMKKREKILGGFKPDDYEMERIFAAAPDGAKIPISIVFKKGFSKDGSRPLLLYGYGAYGSSNDPDFDPNRLSLLDRGFAFAFAHVRGGEEMGREWYENGKLMKKKNTFTDFIACAEHLIRERYTSKEKLVANGMSAGGLLMGAVYTMRPDLFKAVIADVPFVDVINTQLDPTLPLVTEEYEEWGNPQEKEAYFYMKSYAPYENIKAVDYPALLVTAGMNDTRVLYWEPVKFVAKLRSMNTGRNLMLLKTNMDAGHFSVSGRFSYLKEAALGYAFIFKVLGISGKEKSVQKTK